MIDLLSAPGCTAHLSIDEDEKTATVAVRVETGRFRRFGWYRLKIVNASGPISNLEIKAESSTGATPAPLKLYVRSIRAATYVFLGRQITAIHLRANFEGCPEPRIRATLRRITLIEYLWRASSHGVVRHLWAFLHYFINPHDRFAVSFDFPGPKLNADERLRYEHWIAESEPRVESDLADAYRGTTPAKISILMTVCDPEPIYLQTALQSVFAQTSAHWELCIADDASTRAELGPILENAAKDPRVKLVFRQSRGGISAANNSAFALADTDFVTFLDHDDTLAPRAIELCAAYFARHPETNLLYSDEDKIDQQGFRFRPYFKPDFSPELLFSYNYINHLTVHRTGNIKAVGGWHTDFDGAQDFDLTLRILDTIDPATVHHLPLVLYHWRAVAGSAALHIGFKAYGIEAGRASVAETLDRRRIAGTVELLPGTGYHRVRYTIPKPAPKVTIIIPTRDRARDLAICVGSIRDKTSYPNYEILVVDNGSSETKTQALLDQLRDLSGVRVLSHAGPFNYAEINNRAAGQALGEFLCFLNNDTEVESCDWLIDMVGYALQPGVGCVGAKLHFENGTIQHAGIVLGFGKSGVAGHVYRTAAHDAGGYYGRLLVASNYSALTGACLVLRASTFWEVGGFDAEELAIGFNDVDLCLKVRRRGYRNVWTPFAELVHHESVSRGREDTPEKVARVEREMATIRRRYGTALGGDPFYSPHLSLAEPFAIGTYCGVRAAELVDRNPAMVSRKRSLDRTF